MALLQGNEAAQACATWARDGPIDASLLGRVLRRALRGGGDFADCFLEHRQTLTVRLESGRCQGIQAGVEEGAGVRVCGTPTTSYAYTDQVTRAGLMGAPRPPARPITTAPEPRRRRTRASHASD